MPTLPYATHEAVAADGLPRLVTADDQTQHVLYLDGAIVRSMLASDWPPPLPSDPTPQEITATIAARIAAAQQERADAQALRASIVAIARTAVGVRVDQLTPAQLRSLFACIVWKEGGVANDLTIRQLPDWLKQ